MLFLFPLVVLGYVIAAMVIALGIGILIGLLTFVAVFVAALRRRDYQDAIGAVCAIAVLFLLFAPALLGLGIQASWTAALPVMAGSLWLTRPRPIEVLQ
jgi:hypothetical protein